MTDAELQGIALQALNMAKKDMNNRHGNFSGLLATYRTGRGLYRLGMVEALIAQKLGADWLNHGHAKAAAFSIIREMVKMTKPDAMVWCTAVNLFAPTEKLIALGHDAMEKLADEGHDRHHDAVKEGLLSMRDALLALAQTASRVCMYQQPYKRGGFVGQPQVSFLDQDGFGGNLKLYGHEAKKESGNFARKAYTQ